jgi:hypothetical protein
LGISRPVLLDPAIFVPLEALKRHCRVEAIQCFDGAAELPLEPVERHFRAEDVGAMREMVRTSKASLA